MAAARAVAAQMAWQRAPDGLHFGQCFGPKLVAVAADHIAGEECAIFGEAGGDEIQRVFQFKEVVQALVGDHGIEALCRIGVKLRHVVLHELEMPGHACRGCSMARIGQQGRIEIDAGEMRHGDACLAQRQHQADLDLATSSGKAQAAQRRCATCSFFAQPLQVKILRRGKPQRLKLRQQITVRPVMEDRRQRVNLRREPVRKRFGGGSHGTRERSRQARQHDGQRAPRQMPKFVQQEREGRHRRVPIRAPSLPAPRGKDSTAHRTKVNGDRRNPAVHGHCWQRQDLPDAG